MMFKHWTCAVAATLALSAYELQAQEASGDLNVATLVEVSCSAPLANGNLTLPFDGTRALTNQRSSFPVRITATCLGGTVIERVEFGDGLYATTDSSGNTFNPGNASHEHTRRLRGQNIVGEHIAYRLYTDSAGTEVLTTSLTGQADCTAPAPGACNNAFYFENNLSEVSFQIYGRIYDDTGSFSAPRDIEGDIYNDTVTMTLFYAS